MPEAFELSETFVHLKDDGGAEPFRVTGSFWRSASQPGRHDRLLGAFDFESDADLHASMQELHPEADELLYLVSGAIDLVLDEEGGERAVSLEAGQGAVVPRGVWHRLVARRPGRLLFVNSRSGMRSRRVAAAGSG